MKIERIIPNGISLLSLLFGLMAIIKSVEKDFFWAPILIVLACIADSCDGRAARALAKWKGLSPSGSEFGKQMDSLCDLGSFGVAPAIMIYLYGLSDLGIIGQLIAGVYASCGCLRLARFNCNTGTVSGYFQGMPIPAGACCLASYVFSGLTYGPWVCGALTFVVGLILYSNVKFPDFKGHGNPLYKLPVIIGLVLGAAILWSKPSAYLFAGMFTYTAIGVINYFYCALTGKN